LRSVAFDGSKELVQRQAALAALIESRPADLRQICERLLTVRFLNSTAVRGLALFDDADIGRALAKNYQKFHPLDRPAIIDSLASRATFAGPLLEEMAAGKIPRTAVTPFQARQICSFNDPDLTKQLEEIWGQVRDSSAEKQQLIAHWKAKLSADVVAAGDKSKGRVVFNATCASCHSLYGYGDRAGLDLTGAGRNNLDYLLGNIIDPSAVVNADFRMHIVQLEDGRTLNGIIIAKSERTITLKTARESVVIDRSEIETMQESSLSLMPDGIFASLTVSQVCDLISYLMHPSQVPLP